MRLESIDLIRFGHFCGQRIEFPAGQPDFYLIYGDNEAGKSTLLRGISDLLFGVPAQTPDTHSCKGSELRIGATISESTPARVKVSRGSATPVLTPKNTTPALFSDAVFGDMDESEGVKRFSFRRRKGTSGTLLNVNGGQIPDDRLSPFLRDLDRERFEQFFGLTHQRLREGGEELLRGKGDVGSALFQAAGLLELRQLLEKLDDDAKELFSPKSRTRTITRVIEEYKQAKSEVRRLAISAATVKEKQAALEAAAKTLAGLKEESYSLQQELERLRRIKSNKPDLARLQDLRAALAALEKIPILPADAGRQRDEAVAALANANTQITTLTQQITEREKRIESLPANSLLKAHEQEIMELNAGTSAYINSVSHRTKRTRARDEAMEEAQSAWNEIWAHPVSEAENLKIVYADKEEIRRLVAEHKGLTADLANAEEELGNITGERQRLEDRLAQHPELASPAGLFAAIEQAKSLGDTGHLAAKLQSDMDRLARSAQRQMQKLGQWTGSLQQLEGLKTPLLATIDEYAHQWDHIEETRRKLSLRQTNAAEIIRQKERELGSLSARVAEAGESELAGIRSQRDQLWESIRATMSGKKTSRAEGKGRSRAPGSLADEFTGLLQKSDEIADLRFANARDVAIHDRLVKETSAARADQQSIAEEIERLEEAERELRKRWGREWSTLGAPPLSPPEMKEWMQARQAILLQCEQAHEKEEEIEDLRKRAEAAAEQITAKWAALSGDAPHAAPANEPLPVLLRMAEAFAQGRENERRSRDEVRRQLRSLSLEKRQARLDECRRKMLEWSGKWAPYISALSLPENSTPDRVARALAVLENVFQQLDKAKDMQHRVKTIGEDIESFEKRVAQVVAALGPEYAPLAPDAAARQLHSQLVELGKATTERETLQEQNQRDQATLVDLRERAQWAAAILEKLRVLAGCKDTNGEELDAIITASEEKAGKKEEYARISAGLIERNAIADLAQIEQEAAGYDPDFLHSEIAAKEERLKNSVEEISQAASLHGNLTTEFRQLETSEQSALQAQKAEDAVAQLRPAVAQYLRLRLASEVLRKAIESYREKHQGPILRRASELFSRLTAGRHSGLTSDFGDDDKPVLVAIRANGERVQVAGLSDGTRDQLYLSLRLAAIEDHVERVAPCPVIFDDLLINSDDGRASATLRVIGELAKRTQVLFFTHHMRLAELGVKAGAQMIELSSLAASAVA